MITGGIYIHVPFCAKKCHYCSVYSTLNNEENIDLYLNGLSRDIGQYSNISFSPETIYFGGGTPSLLNPSDIEIIIKKLNKNFNLTKLKEVTIEVNPESVTKDRVDSWLNVGINRFSLGVQSFDNQKLKTLGRVHSNKEARKAIELLKTKVGNVSADLICGIPGQSLTDWQKEIEEIVSYDLEHISIYPLQIEPGTYLAQRITDDYYTYIDEAILDMLKYSEQVLTAKNYVHYEISNYSKPNFESKNNLIYWQYKPYLGFGPAAASFYDDMRWRNAEDLMLWATTLTKEYDADFQKEEVKMAEFVFLALRLLNQGVEAASFEETFGVSLENVYSDTLERLMGYGWLTKTEKGYKLNSQAIYSANQIFIELLP